MQTRPIQILNQFAEKVRRVYPDAKIRAYGSYVRGTATDESDLDICVIIPVMQHDDRFVISDIAWEVGLANDLHLSTIVISESGFTHGPVSVSPLLESVKNEGIPV